MPNKAGVERNPWIATFCVFLLFLLTRYIVAPFYELSTEYVWDGMLETCVQPWQFATSQPIAGGDTAYVSHVTTLAVSKIFGYSVRHLQLFIAGMAAVSMGLVFSAFHRIFGLLIAVRIMAVLLVSLPFITWEVMASSMPTGLWGQSLVVYSLTWSPSWKRDLALAASCVLVLLCYPSGVVTVMPLLPLHILFFRPRWPAFRLLSFGALMSAGLLLVWRIRQVVSGHADFTRWGGGRLEVPAIGTYLLDLRVMLTDVFWSAKTWCSGAYAQPYLNVLFCLLLLVGLIRLLQLISNKLTAGWQRSERRISLKLTDQERWLLVFFLTFCVATLVAAIDPGTPGVRRIYTAVLVLIPIIVAAPSLAWRSVWVPRLLHLVFIIALCWQASSSFFLIKSLWPPPPPGYRRWLVTAEKVAEGVAKMEQPAIVIVDRDLEMALDRVFCRLYLDSAARAMATAFYGLELTKQGALVLSKNGDPNQPGNPALEEGFLLVTRSQGRADQLLPSLVARAPANNAPKKVLLISVP
jgi:hypothetical protein